VDDIKVALLEDCEVPAEALVPTLGRLREFCERYSRCFRRSEQRRLSQQYLEGLLSNLRRKSAEPIANLHGVHRRTMSHFVGAGRWDDDKVMRELRSHAVEALGHPEGVLIVDPSAFKKRGKQSVGVKRQWCGELGKTENCQLGVFFGYCSPKGHTLVDRRLYLPQEWAEDEGQRQKCHVPEEVEFQPTWEIAADWLMGHGHEFPHEWVLGDEEFGKSGKLRRRLRKQKERYLLSIQARRTVRVLDPGQIKRGKVRRRLPAFRQVGEWAKSLPPSAWRRFSVRDGEKQMIEVRALKRRVQTKSEGRIDRHVETLLVTQTVEESPEFRYWLTDEDASLETLVEAASKRQWIEHDLKRAKQEVGLGHYELRSWVGWHHHMTLALLALLFLVVEQQRVS
jgi:SRSO17 transposase